MSHAHESDAIPRLLAAPRWSASALDGFGAAGITRIWADDHLRALALVFAEPVLARRREAAKLDWPAVRDVYRLKPLTDDAAAVADRVWNETFAAFQELAATRIRARRLGLRGARLARLAEHEQQGLRRRIARPAESLAAPAERCARAADHARWLEERARLEASWADAWDGVSAAVVGVWADTFAPRLDALRGLRPGPPRWALALLLAAAAIAAFVLLPG